MSLIAPAPIPRLDLAPLAATVDEAFADAVGAALLGVIGPPPDVHLGVLPLYGCSPFDEVLGFRAPQRWSAVGLHCSGNAHPLDEVFDGNSGDVRRLLTAGAEPTDVRLTMLIDRGGGGTALMRTGSTVTPLPGIPEGLIADACRRALGLPTADPPPTTTELWLRVWLDRIVEQVAFDDDVGHYWTFDDVAALHPAWLGLVAIRPPDRFDPDAVAGASHLLAEEWPWSRLRAARDLVETQRPPLTPDEAEWMDDGMFARWLLAESPSVELVLGTAAQLLAQPVVEEITDTLRVAGVRLPCG